MPGSSTPNDIRSDADVDHDQMAERTHDGDSLGAVDMAPGEAAATESVTVPVREPAIPDSGLLHYYPGDEGSGNTLTDNKGSADISLSGTNWVTRSDFQGGSGVEFDGVDDFGTATTTQPQDRTRIIRLEVSTFSNLPNNLRILLGFQEPVLGYHVTNEDWEWRDGSGNDLLASEPISDVEGNVRIVSIRVDSSEARLTVFDSSFTVITEASISNPDRSYTENTMYFGRDVFGTRNFGAMEADPQFITYDHYKTDSELQDVLEAIF